MEKRRRGTPVRWRSTVLERRVDAGGPNAVQVLKMMQLETQQILIVTQPGGGALVAEAVEAAGLECRQRSNKMQSPVRKAARSLGDPVV